ncbi:unnamed protein product, partial [Symbiodinium sp. KB8]
MSGAAAPEAAPDEAVEDLDGHTFYVYDGEAADEEYLVGALAVPAEEGEAAEVFEVIFVCALEERSLVAFPQSAWNRRAAHRRLPPGSLVRATAVEVAAASRTSRSIRAAEARVKIWLGYLEESLVEATRFDGEAEPTIFFTAGGADSGYLPLGEALVEVAKDKFQFHTAESGEPGPPMPTEAQDETRLGRLEEAMQAMAATVKALSEGIQQQRESSLTALPIAESAPAPRTRTQPGAGIGAVVPAHAAAHDPGQDAPTYPGLDPGVVQSALAAGVSHQALGEMASLLSANPALRLKDAKAPKLAADPLDESDQEPVLPVVSQGVASGSAGPAVAPNLDPVSAALVKLTALVEDMHATKNAKGSKLEQALDNVASGQSGGDGGGVTSRKNSVARRALRQALQECPEEIYQVVEKLMLEDLTSTTLSPGMPRPTLSARAWLENRSRLTNYQASVRTAWGVGGILDALIQGKEKEARARACLMLVQSDQVALDRGAWTLASEVSLEQQPPFHSFAAHSQADVSDQPLSRLLEPRLGGLAGDTENSEGPVTVLEEPTSRDKDGKGQKEGKDKGQKGTEKPGKGKGKEGKGEGKGEGKSLESESGWSCDAEKLLRLVKRLGPRNPNLCSSVFLKSFFHDLRLPQLRISQLGEELLGFSQLTSLDVSRNSLADLPYLPPNLRFLR